VKNLIPEFFQIFENDIIYYENYKKTTYKRFQEIIYYIYEKTGKTSYLNFVKHFFIMYSKQFFKDYLDFIVVISIINFLKEDANFKDE